MVQKNKISSQDKIEALVNIHTSTHIDNGLNEAELIVEAVSENEELKTKVFEDIDKYASQELYYRQQHFFNIHHQTGVCHR